LKSLQKAEERDRFQEKLKNSTLVFGLSKADRVAGTEGSNRVFVAPSYRQKANKKEGLRIASKENSSMQDSRLSVRNSAMQGAPQSHPFERDVSQRKIESILDMLLTSRQPVFQDKAGPGKLQAGQSDRGIRQAVADQSTDQASRLSVASTRHIEQAGATAAPKVSSRASNKQTSERVGVKISISKPEVSRSPRLEREATHSGPYFVIKPRDPNPKQTLNPRSFMRMADLAEELSEVPETALSRKKQALVVDQTVQVSRLLEENKFTLSEVKRYFKSKAKSVMESSVNPLREEKLKEARSTKRIRLVDPDDAVRQQVQESKQQEAQVLALRAPAGFKKEAVVPPMHSQSHKHIPRIGKPKPAGPIPKPRIKFSDIYFTNSDALLSKEALKAIAGLRRGSEAAPDAASRTEEAGQGPFETANSAFELALPQRSEFLATCFKFSTPDQQIENRESASVALDMSRSDEKHVHLALFGGTGAGIPKGLDLFDSSSSRLTRIQPLEETQLDFSQSSTLQQLRFVPSIGCVQRSPHVPFWRLALGQRSCFGELVEQTHLHRHRVEGGPGGSASGSAAGPEAAPRGLPRQPQHRCVRRTERCRFTEPQRLVGLLDPYRFSHADSNTWSSRELKAVGSGSEGFMDGLYGHQLVSVPRSYSESERRLLFSFGGVNNFDEVTNDLHSLDLHDNSAAVVLVRAEGQGPSPRFRHGMCFVEKSSLGSSSPSAGRLWGQNPQPDPLRRLVRV
jgi:hypothetical protein